MTTLTSELVHADSAYIFMRYFWTYKCWKLATAFVISRAVPVSFPRQKAEMMTMSPAFSRLSLSKKAMASGCAMTASTAMLKQIDNWDWIALYTTSHPAPNIPIINMRHCHTQHNLKHQIKYLSLIVETWSLNELQMEVQRILDKKYIGERWAFLLCVIEECMQYL